MTLTEITRAVAELRTMTAPARRAAAAALVPALARIAADDGIQEDGRTALLLRTLRAVAPSTARDVEGRPDTPAAALAALMAALEADRRPGRPPKGTAHTVRVDDDTWARVQDLAAQWRVSESEAAARLIEKGLDGSDGTSY